VLVGATTAQATQAIGALLLLGLLAAPAGAAQRITANPYLALALSAVFALAATWIGLAVSYAAPSVPPSTAIVAVACATYAVAALATARGSRASGALGAASARLAGEQN
jgi:zinc/manganese transport system permease protein